MMQYLSILVFLILDFASGPTVDPLRDYVKWQHGGCHTALHPNKKNYELISLQSTFKDIKVILIC
jgi:hypothetical protein